METHKETCECSECIKSNSFNAQILNANKPYTKDYAVNIGAYGHSNNLETSKVEAFFIGPQKFVKSTKDVGVWDTAGGKTYLRTVKAGDTIGKIEKLNATGTWGYLRKDQYNPQGGAIQLANEMYTVNLTTEKPTSIGDAVVREVPRLTEFLGLNSILKPVIIIVIVIGVFYVLNKFPNAKPSFA